MRRWAIGTALACAPGTALAHAFGGYDGFYNNFLDGAAVFLASPGLLLPVLALALALTLWRIEGLLAVWGWVAVATLAGVALAPFIGPWVAPLPLVFGLVVALLAALVPLARIAPAMLPLAVLTGLVVMLAALDGHSWSDVALATRAGLLFGFHLSLAAAAGLVRVLRERFDHPATLIGARIVASWIAAILVLYLAFSLSPPA